MKERERMGIEVSDIALMPQEILHNRYQIQEIHYLGQMTIVYFGWDMQQNRQVVIKEFMPYRVANRDMDGKTVICRSQAHQKHFQEAKHAFEEECLFIQKLKDLKKPYTGCVVQYLDRFEENGTEYLITEKIHGKSLQDYIENGEDFSVRDTMRYLVAIVRQIHKKGIIHCDIKPSNIILDEQGRVILVDFGSACYKKAKKSKLAFVSRGYSAPELYQDGRIDCKTDIYSIGAVLYYMLTDYQLPAPNDYDEEEELPSISEFIQIPSALEKVIMKTLHRDRHKRLGSLLWLQIILNN